MSTKRFWVLSSIGGAVLLAAVFETATVPLGAQKASPATFHKDVLPILQKDCQMCHRPNQVAPFSLLTYEDARPWARSIKAKVVAREMPPWFADPDHGKFRNDRRLSEKEIETLVSWVDGGAIAGNAKDAPAPVKWPADGWEIQPDVVLTGPEFKVPAKGLVEWMYITVPGPFTEDTWVTSVEVRPSNLSVTHHICVNSKPHTPDVKYNVLEWDQIPRDAEGLELPRTKGKADARKLSQKRGSLQEACYVPGSATVDYRPFEAGRLWKANTDIVFTLHYTPGGEDTVDIPRIGFTVTKTPPARRFVQTAFAPPNDAESFAIPPFEANWKSPPAEVTFNEEADLVWMMPHMHVRGKDMTYRLDYPGGRSDVVLNVPNYDFNWQLGYYPVSPIKVPKGTKLRVDAHYDNSTKNKSNPDPSKTVYYGDMTWEEMMSPFIGYTVPMSVDPSKVLKRVGGTSEGSGG